jgi:hypothetical protein
MAKDWLDMKSRYHLLLILSLFVLVLGSACKETPVTYVTFVSQAGISFEYPQDWVTQETEIEIMLASRPELLTGNAYAGGATVNILTGPAGNFQGDLVTILSEVVTLMAEERATEVVTGATAVRINEQEAATVTLAGQEGDTPIRMTAQVIKNDDRIAYLIMIHDRQADRTFGPIMEHIQNSIIVGQGNP